MRPTWHFVDAADIRWMLELTSPRVHAFNAYYYRQLGLDEDVTKRSNTAIIKALRDGNYLTRTELATVLEHNGIAADGMRLGYIVHRAELDAVICSGPRRGKQFTYALLDERAPQARSVARDEALAKLIGRYFTSHGPATVQDFAWWSGLTIADTKAGIEMMKVQLESETIDGHTYWFSASMTSPAELISPTVHFLPNYDEYTVAYKDRSAIYNPANDQYLDSRGNFVFNHTLVIDGQVTGSWKRTLKSKSATIEFAPFIALSDTEQKAVATEIDRLGRFLQLTTALT